MPAETVLVDGYNVLLALTRREGLDPDRIDLRRARARLAVLLEEWAAVRTCQVTVAWDGRSSARAGSDAGPAGIRSVFLEPPAEADDWLVHEAEVLVADRRPVAVVTRDRGLVARLPKAARCLSLQDLTDDLEALRQGPLSAPHVRGPRGAGSPLASAGPVDTRRLPRRHAPGPAATAPSAGRRTALPAGGERPAADLADPRALAEVRKKQRRQRFERGLKRKKP